MELKNIHNDPRLIRRFIPLNTPGVLVLGVFLLIGVLNSTNTLLKPVGLISIILLLITSKFFLFWYVICRSQARVPRIVVSFLFTLIMIFVVYSIKFISTPVTFHGIKIIYQLVSVVGFFLFVLLLDWGDKTIMILSRCVVVLVVVSLLFLVYNYTGRRSVNLNVFGAILYHLLFFLVFAFSVSHKKLQSLFWGLTIVVCLFAIFATNARSLWIAIIAGLLTFYSWSFIIKNKLIFRLYFVFLFLIIGLFVVLYPYLNTIPVFIDFNHQIYEITGKNFFSQRERLWIVLIEAIKEQPITGYGSNVLPTDIIGKEVSAHNLYLQIFLQVGLVGLLLFLFMLWQIWEILRLGSLNLQVRITGAFFIGILVHQAFEVSLTQNHLSIGMIQWTIIGIGINRCTRCHDRGISIASKDLSLKGGVLT